MLALSTPIWPGLAVLAILAIIVLVFMITKGWYGQTVMGLAVVGGIVCTAIGIDRITSRIGNQWMGFSLALSGLLVICVSGIVISKFFRRQ